MTVRTPTMKAAMLVAAFLLLASTGSAQTLTASANPSSGAAGLSISYLTGSGFPSGAITGATVSFATSCAAPAVASAPVTQVTTIGVLRRFQFQIPASLAPGAYKVWVSGTAGTTTFNTLSRLSCSAITVTASVQGTASLGAAIAGANVTLTDANGNTVSGITASDGTFALGSAGLTPPFLVRVVTTTASGGFPAGTTLYSVSADANASTHINVNVLTDLLLRSFYSAQGIDPDAAFSTPTGPNAPPTPGAVLAIANLIVPAVQLWTDNAGITLTGGAPSGGSLNLISSSYVAFPPGVTPPSGDLDALLHLITSESVSPSDGSVSAVDLTSGTVTETISPLYANDLITLNTTTTDSSNPGGGTSAAFSALALTATLQPVIDGIDASLAFFKDTVNTKGAALTGADLLPVYAPDYLNSGTTATQDANRTANEIAGATITSLELTGINSVTFTNNVPDVADVIISSAITDGAQSDTGTDELIFKNEGGVWQLYGNKSVTDAFGNIQARTSRGAPTLGPGVASGTFAFAGLTPAHGLVTQAVVAGPTDKPLLKIWNGPGGTLVGSSIIPRGSQLVQNGQVLDQFYLLSTNLGSDLTIVNSEVPPNSPFGFHLTTASATNNFTAHTNTATTETIHFQGFPIGAPGSMHVPLSAVLGQTINYTFTLPVTYTIGGTSLEAQLSDGPPNLPTTHSCSVSSGNLTIDPVAHTASGSIAFPVNMAGCDASLSGAIVFINVFGEADGVHSETSLVALTMPF